MSELGSVSPISLPTRRQRTVFGPLHETLFRSLWVAAVVSYTGTWMQNVGAGWLMTSLTMSPLMVGLVQAASSIAVFLVVLPAGAVADVVDRRKLLLLTQLWMVLAAAALGVLTIAGAVTPTLLLLFTFLMGFGAVLNDPAWQAITPEIVSRENFTAGIALNSAGFNVARAVGPALGGLVIFAAGSGLAFLLNAVSFFGVIYFLLRWKRAPGRTSITTGHMLETMLDGFRHMRGSGTMHAVLVRTAVFSVSAGALLALLPLLSHAFGCEGYGLMLGIFGVGSLAGAAILSFLRHMMSADALVASATSVLALATYAAGRRPGFWAFALIMLVAGAAWIQILASLNVCAQTMSPHVMRARAISMYLLVLQGGFAGGAALWGAIAERIGLQRSLQYAALALLLGIAATVWFRLHPLAVEPNTIGMD
ncbi:MAG TPA: MFS transporter [Candidatus Eisenbacteria bacterium]|nr:MFS transporter [Candidatus Eisenbacteria bacterium]